MADLLTNVWESGSTVANTFQFEERHREFAAEVRRFLHQDDALKAWWSLCQQKRSCDSVDRLQNEVNRAQHELVQQMFRKGFMDVVPGSAWQGDAHPGGKVDLLYLYILITEFSQTNIGFSAGLISSARIGLFPVLAAKGMQPAAREKVLRACLCGDLNLALCMSDPYAGSDVLATRTVAERDDERGGWHISGVKKWITGGIYADAFVVLARVSVVGGAAGGKWARARAKELSAFLVPRDAANGVKVAWMDCQGASVSGTARVTFDRTFVPQDALLGALGDGFALVMDGMVEERWCSGVSALAMARTAARLMTGHMLRREIGGRPLARMQIPRFRLANLLARLEPLDLQALHLARDIAETRNRGADAFRESPALAARAALFKVGAVRLAGDCVREAQLIFGGLAFERTGPGKDIARFADELHGMHCAGGIDDPLLDGAARAALLGAGSKL